MFQLSISISFYYSFRWLLWACASWYSNIKHRQFHILLHPQLKIANLFALKLIGDNVSMSLNAKRSVTPSTNNNVEPWIASSAPLFKNNNVTPSSGTNVKPRTKGNVTLSTNKNVTLSTRENATQ